MGCSYLGVDPGASGALAILTAGRKVHDVLRLKDKTGAEVKDWLKEQLEVCGELRGAVEQLQPMFRTSKVTMFKLGKSYGHLLGVLDTLEIPYETVRAQQWQKDLKCLTKGKKAVTRAMAQRTWPKWGCTDHDSDALLIALWLSRQPE